MTNNGPDVKAMQDRIRELEYEVEHLKGERKKLIESANNFVTEMVLYLRAIGEYEMATMMSHGLKPKEG